MSRFRPGDLVAGRFAIDARVATGGMAEIYLAEMTLARGVKRRVALKSVHAHLADDAEFATMFLDEARVASQLSHPGLVPIHDAVEHDGELVLVMEYVPGWDLRTVLRLAVTTGTQLPLPVALTIVGELAGTLAYVHRATSADGKPLGIVHRDVTPSNVLVAEDGSLRLLDFGVAKAAERATRTATAAFKGKVAYAAPEQVLGTAITPKTDLYALGLILFELLTLRRANDAPDTLAAIEVARAPVHLAPSELRPEIPPALDALCARLLASDPDERPADGREVVAAIDAIGPELGPGGRDAVRRFVAQVMGGPSRPLAASDKSKLEVALARELGLGGHAGTRVAPKGAPAEGPRQAAVDGDAKDGSRTGEVSTPRGGSSASGSKSRSGRRVPARTWAAAAIAAIIASSAAVIAVVALSSSGAPASPPVVESQPATGQPDGFVRVTTDPPGATVVVDGEPWSERTPTVIPHASGRARIELALEGRDPAARDVSVTAGETAAVDVALPSTPGTIVVTSEPSSAEVRVGGGVRGRTPVTLENLPREPTEVTVALDGYATYEEVAPLDTHARHAIDVTLDRRTAHGMLDVSSTPWARVTVSGRVVAESTPAIGIRLPAGRHTVVLENPRLGLVDRRRVTIRPGETTRIVATLQR